VSPRPADHPDFFCRPPPAGQSRESRIRLDGEGRFWHEEALVDRPALRAALHRWISRHPDDGRYILENGYDWCYFTVDDVPCFVVGLHATADAVMLTLADGSEEPLDPATLREGAGGALYARVKANTPGGAFDAKLTRAAQAALLPLVVEGPADSPGPRPEEDPTAEGSRPYLLVGGRRWPLPSS
jgi:hypothetical protein